MWLADIHYELNGTRFVWHAKKAASNPGKHDGIIRFDADVLAKLKASGRGWQTRVNDAIREWLKTHSPE